MRAAFSFRTRWELAAEADAVQRVLVDLERYPEWWPQVVAVAKIDDDRARVLCKSRLPYTLDLVLTAVHREPRRLESRIEGDLVGVALWQLDDLGGRTRVDYTQDVVVTHRVLRPLVGVLRAPMAWNHARMMEGCRVGLEQRLGVR
ncbi:SRPBCC family protein [Nocardioides sp. GXQ0305]|uniref:SRPBCC family protein n=1 Tax=Nocardioides sp. GXQ0305 TaxID=3423912 RepID=UPI003D7EEA46